MWLRDRRRTLRPAHALAVLMMCAIAAGCNVRPLHSTGPSASTAGDQLSDVAVAPVEGRAGQQVHNHLVFLLHGGRPQGNPRYTLTLNVRQSESRILVRQISGLPQGRTATVRANYTLTDSSGESVYRGSTTRTTPFEWTTQRFGSDRAEREAVNRTAVEVAEDIRARIAAFLASEGEMRGTPERERALDPDVDERLFRMPTGIDDDE